MQNHSRILALSLAVLALAACAGTQEKSAYVEPQQIRPAGSEQPDMQYVARVERAARASGVEVHWVNIPTKHDLGNQ